MARLNVSAPRLDVRSPRLNVRVPTMNIRLPRIGVSRDRGEPVWPAYVVLVLVSYVPLLLSRPGFVAGDTSDLLTLDPRAALTSAASRWQANASLGTIVDRVNDRAFPMSPYFWAAHLTGMPSWVSQRIWMGTILFVGGLGVAVLLRTMWWEGEGWLLAVVAYVASPYVFSQLGVQSAARLAWCALPWLIAATARAVEAPPVSPWRWPARIALVVALTAGASPSAFVAILPAAVLWIVYVVIATREVPWRRALSVVARATIASLVVSAWWIVGWVERPRAEIAALRARFPAPVVAATSTPSETIRGLGDSVLYGGRSGRLLTVGLAYQRVGPLVLVSFVPVAIALLAFARHRFRNRVFFVGLFVVGLVLSVGSSPSSQPEALGRILRALGTANVGSILLPSPRAIPMVALAVAVGFAAGLGYLIETVPDRAGPLKIAGAALLLLSVPAYVSGHSLDGALLRRDVPGYWKQAAADVNAGSADSAVLELPGMTEPDYTWGRTIDPVSLSLIARPVIVHTGAPATQPATADLIAAFDEAIQRPDFSPRAVAPLARLLGVDTILLRFDDHAGPATALRIQGILDAASDVRQHAVYTRPNESKPAIVTYEIIRPVPMVRLIPASRTVVVSGTGASVVDLAEQGLLSGDEAIVYSGGLDAKQLTLIEKKNAGEQKLSMLTVATIGPDINLGTIATEAAGKRRGDVQASLSARAGVKDVSVTYNPFWVTSTPKKASKIKVVIEQNNAK